MSDLGASAMPSGSHPSGHATCGVDGASRFDPSRGVLELGCDKCGQRWYKVDCPEDAAALLDAFSAAIPEKFGHCFGDGRHAGCAAANPLSADDQMWLRGIAAAIFANHPLARMVRHDEALGLYDDDAIADRSPKGRDKGTLSSVHESGGAKQSPK